MSEIAFVGKAPGRYQLWLGGNASGTRLNRIHKDVIKEADIETELRPLLSRWKNERIPQERFGDFAARVFWPEVAAAEARAKTEAAGAPALIAANV
jgi:sulfite reductase (NADPH) hemoprotein beta-component